MTEQTRNWLNYKPAADAFADRVILVTGATSGIGRAVARELVRHGATVLLHGRNTDRLQKLFDELSEIGPEPALIDLDLEKAQGPAYQDLTEKIEERYARLDGLLHNAAMLGERTPVEHYDIGLWQRVVHVNLTAPFILTRCLLPLLRASNDASILFTTSDLGHHGRAYWGAYSASKFAIEGFSQVLADELDRSRIRVNCINPGVTRSRMRALAYPGEDPATLPPPESLTGPYLYLLGPDSRGFSGQRVECQDQDQDDELED